MATSACRSTSGGTSRIGARQRSSDAGFQVVPEPVERTGKNLHLHVWVLGPESVEGRDQGREGKQDVHSEADAVLLASLQRFGMSRKTPRTFDCRLASRNSARPFDVRVGRARHG